MTDLERFDHAHTTLLEVLNRVSAIPADHEPKRNTEDDQLMIALATSNLAVAAMLCETNEDNNNG